MTTYRIHLSIPAAWLGLAVWGSIRNKGDGWVDGLGRAVLPGRADDLADPRPHVDDRRAITVTEGPVEAHAELEVRHDEQIKGMVPYGIWTEVRVDGHVLEGESEPELHRSVHLDSDDPSREVVLTTSLQWPTANRRHIAVDTVKRIWRVTSPVAARAVDTLRPDLLPALGWGRLTLQTALAGLAFEHLPPTLVAPLVIDELAEINEDCRVMTPPTGGLMVRFEDEGGTCQLFTPGHNWSIAIIGGQKVATSLSQGGGPEPRRTAKAIARLVTSHPARHRMPIEGMSAEQLGEVLTPVTLTS